MAPIEAGAVGSRAHHTRPHGRGFIAITLEHMRSRCAFRLGQLPGVLGDSIVRSTSLVANLLRGAIRFWSATVCQRTTRTPVGGAAARRLVRSFEANQKAG